MIFLKRQSSSLSLNFNKSNEITASITTSIASYEPEKIFIIEDTTTEDCVNTTKNPEEVEERVANESLVSVENDENNHYESPVLLSMESLEQIRKRASSMSLPMLTALCSDQALINSLKQK